MQIDIPEDLEAKAIEAGLERNQSPEEALLTAMRIGLALHHKWGADKTERVMRLLQYWEENPESRATKTLDLDQEHGGRSGRYDGRRWKR